MSTVEEKHSEVGHAPKPYEQVFIALFVLTIIEVAIGYLETGPLKIVILLFLALLKAGLVAAVFMHVRYDKDPRMIVIFSFLVPLFGAIILATVIYRDHRS